MHILHFWEFEDEKPSKYYILHFRDVKMLKMFQKWYCLEILRATYVQKKPDLLLVNITAANKTLETGCFFCFSMGAHYHSDYLNYSFIPVNEN